MFRIRIYIFIIQTILKNKMKYFLHSYKKKNENNLYFCFYLAKKNLTNMIKFMHEFHQHLTVDIKFNNLKAILSS